MRLKIFEARTMPEAMARMRATLGPDALILDSRPTEGGIAITAGIEPEPQSPPWPHRKILAFHNVPSAVSLLLEQHRHELHGELPVLKSRRPRRLTAPWSLLADAAAASSNLARSLADVFQFGSLSWNEPVVLAGPPGAGKTLSLVKLVVKLVRDGTPPLVINADHYRAAALPQLGAFTGLLDLELIDAPTLPDLESALAERNSGVPVLIDTPGINPFDEADARLLRSIREASGGTIALVLPAGLDLAESAELAEAFFELGATQLVPTRFDLTQRLGSVLAAAAAAPYVITEAGIGPGAADGMASLTPELLAEYLYHPYAASAASESNTP
jgi:flagellar biosynthesis protein FlhF